jgi:hypothetical protein
MCLDFYPRPKILAFLTAVTGAAPVPLLDLLC